MFFCNILYAIYFICYLRSYTFSILKQYLCNLFKLRTRYDVYYILAQRLNPVPFRELKHGNHNTAEKYSRQN